MSAENDRRAGLLVRALTTIILVAVGIVGTTGVAEATPNHWGAIALSPSTGSAGYSWDHRSQSDAARRARRECGRSDCQTLVTVANGCAALAQARNRALGWAYGASLSDAKRRAVRATPGRGARVIGWVCTTRPA